MDDTGLNERALTASALRIPITRFFNRCLAVFDMPRGHALDSARRALEASTEQTGRSGRRCNLLGSWENEESPVTKRFNSSRGIFDENGWFRDDECDKFVARSSNSLNSRILTI